MLVNLGLSEGQERSFRRAVDLFSFVNEREIPENEYGNIAVIVWDSGVEAISNGCHEYLYRCLGEEIDKKEKQRMADQARERNKIALINKRLRRRNRKWREKKRKNP